jgi:hypothetical protein
MVGSIGTTWRNAKSGRSRVASVDGFEGPAVEIHEEGRRQKAIVRPTFIAGLGTGEC